MFCTNYKINVSLIYQKTLKNSLMKKLNAFFTIASVSIACMGLFFAMFQFFATMLFCLTASFVISSLIKN